MRRIILAILLAVSLVGFVEAQDATLGKTEQVKKEIMELEQEKISALGKGVPAIVEWFERVNSEDLAHTDPISGNRTKAQCIAEFQSGKLKVKASQHIGLQSPRPWKWKHGNLDLPHQ